MVPKKITQDQIKLPEDWTLNGVCPITTPVSENLQQIEEFDDGSVRIKFNSSWLILIRPNLVKELAGASTVAIANNTSTYIDTKRRSSRIARSTYEIDEGKSSMPARPISPTLSDMGYSTINIHIKR